MEKDRKGLKQGDFLYFGLLKRQSKTKEKIWNRSKLILKKVIFHKITVFAAAVEFYITLLPKKAKEKFYLL